MMQRCPAPPRTAQKRPSVPCDSQAVTLLLLVFPLLASPIPRGDPFISRHSCRDWCLISDCHTERLRNEQKRRESCAFSPAGTVETACWPRGALHKMYKSGALVQDPSFVEAGSWLRDLLSPATSEAPGPLPFLWKENTLCLEVQQFSIIPSHHLLRSVLPAKGRLCPWSAAPGTVLAATVSAGRVLPWIAVLSQFLVLSSSVCLVALTPFLPTLSSPHAKN